MLHHEQKFITITNINGDNYTIPINSIKKLFEVSPCNKYNTPDLTGKTKRYFMVTKDEDGEKKNNELSEEEYTKLKEILLSD